MIWLILSIFLWGIVHSILASLKVKELVQRRLGAQLMRFYRLLYNLFALISFLPIPVLAVLIPDTKLYLVTFPWNLLMVTGEVLAVAALLIGFLQTDALDFVGLRQLALPRKPARLVTSGFYRYVRHPLYSAGLALIWLVPYMTANLLAINIGLTVYLMVGAIFEERKLKHEFGQQYDDYVKVTPMFIPFLKGKIRPR